MLYRITGLSFPFLLTTWKIWYNLPTILTEDGKLFEIFEHFFAKMLIILKNILFISSVYFISYTCICISNQVIYWKYDFSKMTNFFIAFFAMLALIFFNQIFRKEACAHYLTSPNFFLSLQELETKL